MTVLAKRVAAAFGGEVVRHSTADFLEGMAAC